MRANSISHKLAVTAVILLALGTSRGWGDIPIGFNGGFERPQGVTGELPVDWAPFSSKDINIGISTNIQRSGTQALEISAQGRQGSHLGVFQNLRVEPKKRYTFQAHVINSRSAPLNGNVYGMIGIEFRDSSGHEISRQISPQWNRYLSKMKWERFEVEARAPKNAAVAHFVIYLIDGDDGPSKGSVLVDDVIITRK